MTLRIETKLDGERAVVYLTGRITVEHLEELKAQIRAGHTVTALDLDQVHLVDVEAVRFMAACETEGIEILNGSPYIQEWIRRERANAGSAKNK